MVIFRRVDRLAKHNIAAFCPSTTVMFFGFRRNSGLPERTGEDVQGAARLSRAPCSHKMVLHLLSSTIAEQQQSVSVIVDNSCTSVPLKNGLHMSTLHSSTDFTCRRELGHEIDANAVMLHMHTFTYTNTPVRSPESGQ